MARAFLLIVLYISKLYAYTLWPLPSSSLGLESHFQLRVEGSNSLQILDMSSDKEKVLWETSNQ